MICQIAQVIKSLSGKIWEILLVEFYQTYVTFAWKRSIAITVAENGQRIDPTDYIMYGTYGRAAIYDVVKIKTDDGKWKWVEVKVEGLRIQRIQNRDTKETHGILNDFLIPYERYSLRYILYHLYCYFLSNKTIEEYCFKKRFDESTLKSWLGWMKQNITVLCDIGLTESNEENREMLKRWVQNIASKLYAWDARSLRLTKRGLFQRHKMPERSESQNEAQSG